MKAENDLHDVITGMAQLGEIYLRIAGRLRSLYEKNPRLRFEARQMMRKAGYEVDTYPITDMVDAILSGRALKRTDRLFLHRYARTFYDPVLVQEVMRAFAEGGEDERRVLMERLAEQLSIFPDPRLGFGDLYEYGYHGTELFPVRKEIATILFSRREVLVYAIYEDGSAKAITDQKTIVSHQGMFGVRREEWTTHYIEAFREGREITFDFREPEKEYRIYQWKKTDERIRDYSFMPYDVVTGMGAKVDVHHYDLVYEGRIRRSATLDDIFEMFNINLPDDYEGHSLSVGDVVAIREKEEWEAFYVDSFGFCKVEAFMAGEDKPQLMASETKKEPEKELPAQAGKEKEPVAEKTKVTTSKRSR